MARRGAYDLPWVQPVSDHLDLQLTSTRSGGRTVLAVAGELDIATADRFLASAREHLAAAPALLDLRGLTFMDSSGVRALSRLVRDAEAQGWALAIDARLAENVRQLLELTGLLALLPLEAR